MNCRRNDILVASSTAGGTITHPENRAVRSFLGLQSGVEHGNRYGNLFTSRSHGAVYIHSTRSERKAQLMHYELESSLRQDNIKVVEALRDVGINVNSVYDLVNTKRAYPGAIPVLVEMLPLVKSDRIREGIARALAIKEAGPIAAGPLIKAFRSAPDKTESQRHAKWAIGKALSVVANEAVFKDIFELATQKHHGWTRSMLISVLPKMKKNQDQIRAALLRLLDDEDPAVLREAVTAVGKLKHFEAVSKLEVLLTHDSSTIRAGVRRVLRTLRPLLGH